MSGSAADAAFTGRKETMAGFLVRVLIVALGLWLASELVPGLEVRGGATLLGAALLLGIVNAVVRPVLIVLTLPITILTLGLFLLVINAAMLGLVASLFEDFRIASFWSALLGSLVVSFTGWIASWLIGPRGRVEVMVARDREWRG
jgi:putative membrane protein